MLYSFFMRVFLFLFRFLSLSLLVGWASLPQSVRAQQAPATPLSLREAVKYSLEHNASVQNARLDEYISQKKVKEVLASGMPQASIAASGQYFLALPQFYFGGFSFPSTSAVVSGVTPGPNGVPVEVMTTGYPLDENKLPIIPESGPVEAGVPWQSSATLSINQLIFSGSYFVGLEASRELARLSSKQVTQSQQETAGNVISAYYTAMVTAEQLKLFDINIERLQQMYDQTNAMSKSGFVELIDVERLEVTLNNLKLQRMQVVRGVELTKDVLKFQMGMPVDQDITLTESIANLNPAAPGLEISASFNPEKRIEYQLVQSAKQLELYNQKNIRAGYLPTVAAFFNGSYNAQADTREGKEFGFDYFQALVGLQVSIPVFDGFAKKHQMAQSRFAVSKMDNNMAQLENAIRLETRQAVMELQNAYTSLESYKRNQTLAQHVYDVATTKYKEGVGSSLEVTTAEIGLREAQQNYLTTLFSYLQAKVKLEKAKGELEQYYN